MQRLREGEDYFVKRGVKKELERIWARAGKQKSSAPQRSGQTGG
jgi:hypothetical protein